jgi:hypothetical protein
MERRKKREDIGDAFRVVAAESRTERDERPLRMCV